MIPFVVILYQFFKRLKIILSKPELRGMLLFMALLLLLGSWIYCRVEHWSLLDAFYFSMVTLTTIGYGDLTPKTAFGKFFTIIYIFLGIGVLAVFISTVAEQTMDDQKGLVHGFREKTKPSEKITQGEKLDSNHEI